MAGWGIDGGLAGGCGGAELAAVPFVCGAACGRTFATVRLGTGPLLSGTLGVRLAGRLTGWGSLSASCGAAPMSVETGLSADSPLAGGCFEGLAGIVKLSGSAI